MQKPDSKLTAADVDDRMIDFLSWFDYETAKVALDEYSRCVTDKVRYAALSWPEHSFSRDRHADSYFFKIWYGDRNRKAFIMGILKRFRTTDGAE